MGNKALARLAGIAGIVGIVLLLVANLQLGSPPAAEDSAATFGTFVDDKRDQILVYAVLFTVGYVLLISFAAGLFQVLRAAGDSSGLPALSLVAATWVIVVGTIGIIAPGAAAFRSPAVDANTARSLLDLSNISFALIGAPFAVLFTAASLSGSKTGALPRWVARLGYLTSILNLAKVFTVFASEGPFASGGAAGVIPVLFIWAWTIAVGIVLIRGRAAQAAPAAQPAAASA